MTIEEVVISERTRIAKEEGLEEGREEIKELGATNMLLKGFPVETIADLLELNPKKVNEFKSKLKKQGKL